MMKKKIIGLLLFPLTVLLAFFLVQEATIHATEHADVITKMYFTDKDGNELPAQDIRQWQQFRINVDFNLHNNEVKAGDTTVLQLPDVVAFPSGVAFDLLDKDGNVVSQKEWAELVNDLVYALSKYLNDPSFKQKQAERQRKAKHQYERAKRLVDALRAKYSKLRLIES